MLSTNKTNNFEKSNKRTNFLLILNSIVLIFSTLVILTNGFHAFPSIKLVNFFDYKYFYYFLSSISLSYILVHFYYRNNDNDDINNKIAKCAFIFLACFWLTSFIYMLTNNWTHTFSSDRFVYEATKNIEEKIEKKGESLEMNNTILVIERLNELKSKTNDENIVEEIDRELKKYDILLYEEFSKKKEKEVTSAILSVLLLSFVLIVVLLVITDLLKEAKEEGELNN